MGAGRSKCRVVRATCPRPSPAGGLLGRPLAVRVTPKVGGEKGSASARAIHYAEAAVTPVLSGESTITRCLLLFRSLSLCWVLLFVLCFCRASAPTAAELGSALLYFHFCCVLMPEG